MQLRSLKGIQSSMYTQQLFTHGLARSWTVIPEIENYKCDCPALERDRNTMLPNKSYSGRVAIWGSLDHIFHRSIRCALPKGAVRKCRPEPTPCRCLPSAFEPAPYLSNYLSSWIWVPGLNPRKRHQSRTRNEPLVSRSMASHFSRFRWMPLKFCNSFASSGLFRERDRTEKQRGPGPNLSATGTPARKPIGSRSAPRTARFGDEVFDISSFNSWARFGHPNDFDVCP
jgi:hypothetical protein